MAWLGNLRIKTKLLLAFGALALLLAVVGYQGVRGVALMEGKLEELHEVHVMGLDHLRGADLRISLLARELRGMLLDATFKNPQGVERARVNMQKYDAEFIERYANYQKSMVSPQEKTDAAEILAQYQTWRSGQDKLAGEIAAGRLDDAYAHLTALRTQASAIDERMQRLRASKRDGMIAARGDTTATYVSARNFIIGLVVVAVVLAIAVGLFIARVISRPLVATAEVLRDIAEGEGDLTRRLPADRTDEVGEVARWFNAFMDKLHELIGQARGVATQVAHASSHLSAAGEQMASGAQEQASSLEQTAASLEEITGTVKQNADNARQANQLAVGSRGTAEKGGQVVTAAVAAMGEINRASKKVADIIATIDEIAFQTNLLALNAAVEAARAGEQGRGFAVVAAEVRNLAQRSAAAAKEIKGLIQDSVAKVEAGSELVNQSGQTLEEIVTSVKRVTDIIGEIAAASQEQSSGVDQVNRAVTQMDHVVQANAAQTEELSSTAESLAGQATELQRLVGRFKIAEDARAMVLQATRVRDTRRGGAAPKRLGLAPVKVPALRPIAKKALTKTTPQLAGATAPKNGRGADDGFEEF